ncbi:hypothetical protein [Nitrosopumilus sp.]|uniref:hypothetical protein n=1 Tax=Nitrosopumilus sp. TaxID=2024843 RepID=UPI00247E5335|nr:hypothetical protein [Nitrosopumilus sp.]MCV0430702.1 hypothetical protein [Nitrosopumilus sp.]
MPSYDLLLKERYESIRSQLVSLKSTISLLKHNYWTIYSNFSSKNTVPPFIFPTMTFSTLEDYLEKLILNCLASDPTKNISKIFSSQNELSDRSNELLTEIVRMYTSLTQRIAGTGLMNQIETHSISQFEQGTSIKSYQAVDALSYDLVNRILGKKWMTDNSYIPFSIFDYEGYSMNPLSYVATLPYPDTFRSRFWPVMAHEISHILVYTEVQKLSKKKLETIREPKSLGELLFYSIEELLDILKLRHDENNSNTAYSQITELFCDIIATYTCPILFITGTLNLRHYLEPEQHSLLQALQIATHPPSDSRIIAMKTVLDRNKILKNDSIFQEYAESVLDLNNEKNSKLIDLNSFLFLTEYNEFAAKLANKVVNYLEKSSIQGLKSSEWKLLLNGTSDLLGRSPTMAMNILWQKRLKTIKKDTKKSMIQYFNSRHTEFQLLENFINSAYQYYVGNIFPKIEEKGRYDVRINTC